jgi:hypothetical protein
MFPGLPIQPATQDWRGAMAFTQTQAQLAHQEYLIHDSLLSGKEAYDFANVYAWTGRTYLLMTPHPDLTALPTERGDSYGNVAVNIMSGASGLQL